ncbi:MAG: tryptophan halogenase family protein [Rubripirellula sp.]
MPSSDAKFPNYSATSEPQNSWVNVQHIAIIGGGTAGWMSAATLRRRLGCKVTLIESHDQIGVGVGEATIPALIDWIQNMGIDEDEFLRRTGATYKLAIRFDNWITPNHRYWHPFGSCGGTVDGCDLVHLWAQSVRSTPESEVAYTDFSLQKQLCDQNGSPRTFDDSARLENYAFHLDAGKLARFIREIAIEDGVDHRIGSVIGANQASDGSIESVQIAEQEPVVADMYIDCSGFAAVLIEKSLDVPWIDWSDQLLCDRAVVTRAPVAGGEIPPYTVSTGMSAGWSWQIPLMEATGVGYVYSSSHISDDQARSELLSFNDLDAETNTRQLSMRIGHRTESWKQNCVAIGLSSGFVEPLESTGIFLVQRALDDLVECMAMDGGDREFNTRTQVAYEEVRDFVLLHYVLSRRDDTEFWRDCRSVQLPASLNTSLENYRVRGEVFLPEGIPSVFAEVNHHFIMAGAGELPGLSPAAAPMLHLPSQREAICNHVAQTNLQLTGILAPHHEVLRCIHRTNEHLPQPTIGAPLQEA